MSAWEAMRVMVLPVDVVMKGSVEEEIPAITEEMLANEPLFVSHGHPMAHTQ